MHEDSIYLTAFVTKKGLYEWLVLPFGVKNGPGIFTRRVRYCLADYDGDICVVYVDDIGIAGETWEEFLVNLDKVLTRLSEFDEMEYLGIVGYNL